VTTNADTILLAIGLDGAKSGWIGACLHQHDDQTSTALRLFPDIDAVAHYRAEAGNTAPVAIDVPIGLTADNGFRPCDLAARERLGPMRSSVFAPPARFVHDTTNHPRALDRIRERQATDATIRSISAQAHGIIRKIAEIDTYARTHPDSERWLIECHPELSFQALNDGLPLVGSKRSIAGAAQRHRLVRDRFPDAELQLQAARWPASQADITDAIDAYAALATAIRYRAGTHDTLGGDHDDHDIPMRMVI
jgi:predicted RNase H-like nuclease